ncbi:MAG: S8 family serine peptidase [Acidobacteria bacterium]|nr:S8 family serine peptidase [Acidobacteriota bacterium]
MFAVEPDPDRYIVSFSNPGQGKAALRAAGARIELDLPRHDAAAAHIPAHALAGLRQNPNIAYIEPDALRFPMAQTTPWGIPAVQADLVDDGNAGNRTVCIIDSGYWNGHEDLQTLGSGDTSPDSGTGDPLVDQCHHGTHVAGTVSALTNTVGVVGVLPGGTVGLHIVKVFGDDCIWAYSSTLIAAADACVTAGSNIISMSLGGGFKSRTENRAFADFFSQGVLSVAAAGNDGNTRKSYPASYDSVVSVAAVDSALVVADFSQQNDQVELSGPGVAVRSTVEPGEGFEESLTVATQSFEATGMQGSPAGTGTGALFRCNAVDGLGSPGDCAGADGKVCLIKRGDITFADKVVECQDQGGTAAVIFNNSDALFSGTLGETVTSIQSVGVSGTDGQTLENTLLGTSTSVTTDTGNYAYFAGTSMATPHVSGVAALVWSQDLTCSNQEIRDTLAATALDLGAAGRDNAYGFGLVQAADAVLALNCDGGTGGGCTLLPTGSSCELDGECCSGKCKGRSGSKTCK